MEKEPLAPRAVASSQDPKALGCRCGVAPNDLPILEDDSMNIGMTGFPWFSMVFRGFGWRTLMFFRLLV